MLEIKSIETIIEELSLLERKKFTTHFEVIIGPYLLMIYTHRIGESPFHMDDRITYHEVVDISLYEVRSDGDFYIYISKDKRFKHYKPIQYDIIETPNGVVNLSNGVKMPVTHLCELIRYLYRLANLTVFL